jgi:hypothetical protein
MSEVSGLINRNNRIIALLGLLFGIGFYFSYLYLQLFQKSEIKGLELRVKPNVAVDPSRRYQITLWDYDWPLAGDNYRKYLQTQIAAFNQRYPNITVKLRLLDLLTGPAQLAAALRRGAPPDVYCSALTTPGFDFKYQVPVGPYLAPRVRKERYFPGIARLTELNGVQCYFPRWVRPELWVGNRRLLERAGLAIARIQAEGWNWEDVLKLRARIPAENYLAVGKVIPEGILQKIGSQGQINDTAGAEWALLRKIRDSKGIPSDGGLQMIEYFCSGQAALLAGVKPIIWRYLRTRLARTGAAWEAVILPAPARSKAQTAPPLELGVISVYRRPRLGCWEQVAAAVKLGEHLSRCSGDRRPWVELMVIPAARIAAADWARRSGMGEKILKIMEPGLVGGNWCLPLPDQARLRQIEAVLQQYLSGQLSQAATVKCLRTQVGAGINFGRKAE